MEDNQAAADMERCLDALGVRPGLLPASQREELDQRGYVVLGRLLDDEWLTLLRQHFEELIAAEGDQALPRSRLRSHDHGEWDQVTAPDAGVAQRDPVVAAAGTLQVDVGGTDDIACHFIAPRLVARQASRTAPYLRGTDGPGTEPITSQNRRFCSQAILAVEPDRGKTAPARPRARHWKNENFAAEQIQTAPLGGPSERGRTAIFCFALSENRSPCRRAPINGTCNASA